MSTLAEYFEKVKGTGVLGTAGADGKVNAAIYSRPYFISENKVAFIMADRLSHNNIRKNPKAVYLFIDDPEQYTGKRLYLSRTDETEDKEQIESFRKKRECPCPVETVKMGKSYLVYFTVDSVLPLIGDQE
jgi:hypothetical protein